MMIGLDMDGYDLLSAEAKRTVDDWCMADGRGINAVLLQDEEGLRGILSVLDKNPFAQRWVTDTSWYDPFPVRVLMALPHQSIMVEDPETWMAERTISVPQRSELTRISMSS